jgi:hypothetical protein
MKLTGKTEVLGEKTTNPTWTKPGSNFRFHLEQKDIITLYTSGVYYYPLLRLRAAACSFYKLFTIIHTLVPVT